MKAVLIACFFLGVIAIANGSYSNRVQANNGYQGITNYQQSNNQGYGLNRLSCRPLGTPSQNIADCCSQSSAPIDRSNLNKCCLAQGQFCNGNNDKCCYSNGQIDCVPTGNPNMGIRTCQRVTAASSY